VKNTVCIGQGARLVIEPTAAGVWLTLTNGELTVCATLGVQEVGAALFAIESAAEASETMRQRARALRAAHELARAGA
jgi:hypothetical protein